MGLKSWFARRAADKGRWNIVDAVTKLVPVCDEQWDRTVAAIMAQHWPLRPQDPNVDRCRLDLLRCLLFFKGPITDREVLEIVGATMKKLGARAGAQMAIRYLVMEEWPKQDLKLSLTQEQMANVLGTRDKDEQHKEQLRQYALHYLALEQAVKEVTGKSPR
jgi:hypothetical protein